MLMDQARKLDGLEALVLIHQDAEIIDPDFLKKIREALSDPDVAIVGCAGAIGVRNIAWWDGSVTWASFTHRYEELGGGEVPGARLDARGDPDLRGDRRGRDRRRLRAGDDPLGAPGAPLRRVARPGHPRLRLRPLPAGAREGQEGGDRRPEGRPPPRPQADPRRRQLDRGPRQGRREVGRPDAAGRQRGRPGGLEGPCQARRGPGICRADDRPVVPPLPRCPDRPARAPARADGGGSHAPAGGQGPVCRRAPGRARQQATPARGACEG